MTLPAETRADAFGTLTDEAFVRSRRRLGVPRPQVNPPHNYEVTWDGCGISHTATVMTTRYIATPTTQLGPAGGGWWHDELPRSSTGKVLRREVQTRGRE